MNGEMRRLNNAYETINAAANAIASSENRVPQTSSVQKRRWGSWWSVYWCFRSNRQTKRIRNAVLVPETTEEVNNLMVQNSSRSLSIVLPFVAPPSSPTSFLLSEPPSTAHSPAGSVSLSANIYSPGGPASIFAIGPYAHETQLVSPPVFSTFTTEPSTAPFTPPPESLQLTTPSSPEVPFARLLEPNQENGKSCQNAPFFHYDFQSYQLYPGSPVGQLISPRSCVSGSGTSSPFADRYSGSGNLGKLSLHEWGSQGSGSFTPETVITRSSDGFVLNRQKSDIFSANNAFNGWRHNKLTMDHRVSFELTAGEVVRCVEKKNAVLHNAISMSPDSAVNVTKSKNNSTEWEHDQEGHQKHRSITPGSCMEFNFDSTDGGNSDKTSRTDVVPCENWSFFPVVQSGCS